MHEMYTHIIYTGVVSRTLKDPEGQIAHASLSVNIVPEYLPPALSV